MATKQDLINMTKLARIDAYYADSYEECEEPTADEAGEEVAGAEPEEKADEAAEEITEEVKTEE